MGMKGAEGCGYSPSITMIEEPHERPVRISGFLSGIRTRNVPSKKPLTLLVRRVKSPLYVNSIPVCK
jgi:hypothetical protein